MITVTLRNGAGEEATGEGETTHAALSGAKHAWLKISNGRPRTVAMYVDGVALIPKNRRLKFGVLGEPAVRQTLERIYQEWLNTQGGVL